MAQTQTSLAAYQSILPRLNNLEDKVLKYIYVNPGCYDRDIARYTGLEISSVCGRRNSLLKQDMIFVDGKVRSATGKLVNVYRCTDKGCEYVKIYWRRRIG